MKNNRRVIDFISNTGRNFGKAGDPRRVLYSVPFAGLDEDGFPTFYNEKGETVKNLNLQNKEDVDFLKYVGNKLRLDQVFSRYYTDFTALPKEFKNRYILPGDEQYTHIPVIPTKRQTEKISDLRYAYNIYNYSDVRVADGGFVRMKEISLTYDVPKKLIAGAGFNSLSLKLQTEMSDIVSEYGQFLLYVNGDSTGKATVTDRTLNLSTDSETKVLSYAFTPTGIRLAEPFTVNGATMENFEWNTSAERYDCIFRGWNINHGGRGETRSIIFTATPSSDKPPPQQTKG